MLEYGRREMFTGFWVEYLKEREISGDLCLGGRIILTWTLKK
jgi:hypothetical protein